MFVPVMYKPVLWVARRMGLLDAFGDQVMARLIPQPLLDAANEALSYLAGALEPAVSRVNADLDAVVKASGAAIEDFLNTELPNAVVTVSRSATAAGGPAAVAHSGQVASTTRQCGQDTLGGRSPPLVVQRSWREATTALAAKMGGPGAQVILSLVKPAKKQTADAAVRILKKIKPLLGEPVTNDGKPMLPAEAYSYVRDKRNVIIRIRRRPEWAGSHLPKLKIETGRIAVGSGWDWKRSARSELARALAPSPGPDFQAHHCIPLGESHHPIILLAIKNGWNLNGAENGVWVHNEIHGTSHEKYNKAARRELDELADKSRNRPWVQPDPSSPRRDISTGLSEVIDRLGLLVREADARGGRLL
jgi:A nuclease family of the HNH/ENDO VII superfamily with conserved AHH